MDHWGDPWADNANGKSPTKDAVTSPLPPAFPLASVPLNGFVDDAGWGNNDDDGFGDWATSPRVGTGNVALTDARSPLSRDKILGSANWDTVSHDEREGTSADWPKAVLKPPLDLESVDSEPSDSATVSQLDDVVEQETAEALTPQPQPENESSARSSTSPSETSRNELPAESPRTSIEDERFAERATKDILTEEDKEVGNAAKSIEEPEAGVSGAVFNSQAEENRELSQFEDVKEHQQDSDRGQNLSLRQADEPNASGTQDNLHSTLHDADVTTLAQPPADKTSFAIDSATLDRLFPSPATTSEQPDAQDDPIYSTSARKAWYRLTRKQTMREFNHGDNDDNYIRITWTNSHVRAEVHKVVSRWAREDRISGTGPGARASFYWDTPAPAESKTLLGHLGTHSSIPAKKAATLSGQGLPPPATDKSAAFDWNSPASADPWRLESCAQRSTSTPLTLKNPAVAKVQRQEGRAVSVDLTPRSQEQTLHKRTLTVSHTVPETTNVANLFSLPVAPPSTEVSHSWANFTRSDTSLSSTTEIANPPIDDDDDDWGEMIQTPTLPTPTQLDPFSQSSTFNDTLPSSSTESTLQKPIPSQAESAEPMFASPIVRLQSTISPTSALFKANSFIPLHVEQGPVGPGILRPTNQTVRLIPGQKFEEAGVAAIATDAEKDGNNDESFTQAASEPMLLAPKVEQVSPVSPVDKKFTTTTQPATPIKAVTDSWEDADLSFFESALPVTASQPPLQAQDTSNSFSLDAPIPQRTLPSSRTFSRSPPRNITPPSLRPLTGATGSLQRRKAEEDHIISGILEGLPDLSYMLR